MINFKIDGIQVEAEKGETILNVARKNDIYIPTMCYITKTMPCASCRMCVVEAEGVDGLILSCNTPPTKDINIITNSQELEKERTNIMKLYDVNHPLECGVCDKSGECDLQNKTLEFDIQKQNFSAKDQIRPIKKWGLINYDPALCILCEKCVHVCNEVIGDDAIEVKFGGYNSIIIPKNADELDCTFCGECIAVCPVGALISSNFQYTANAWELKRVPAICVHCSGGCSLEYETRVDFKDGKNSIYRVKNNFEYESLCGAGRFGFDFENSSSKDKSAFKKAIKAILNAEAIRFSSMISNEEAYMLQELKEKLGIKLFNEDARLFQKFMNSYSSVSGKKHFSASLDNIKKADGVIVLGSKIASDNPAVRYALTTASRHKGAQIVYAHSIEDVLVKNIVTQFMKYEVGTEEGVIALLANAILAKEDISNDDKEFFKNLDLGYLSAESNIGLEETSEMMKSFSRSKNMVFIIGNDILAHDKSENIAKLVALIEKYTSFSVLVVPSEVNTLGVSLINTLDVDEEVASCIGYNADGNFIISSLKNANLAVPSLNQQEGSFVSIDNRLVPTNVGLGFDGYTLNEILAEFGIIHQNTIDCTALLSSNSGFKKIQFDLLENFLNSNGEDCRGYLLDEVPCKINYKLNPIDNLPEYNGTVIYYSNPVLQFNAYTNITKQIERDTFLRGSSQFAIAAKISDGDMIEISTQSGVSNRKFKLDNDLKGMVALNPYFDMDFSTTKYKFEKSKIKRITK